MLHLERLENKMEFHEYIYLQVEDEDGNAINQYTEPGWTWCQDRIRQSDVEYVKANLVQHWIELLSSSEQTLRNLGNGELSGDVKQIALNAAHNIREALSEHKTSHSPTPPKGVPCS